MKRPAIAFVNPSVGFSDRRKSKPVGLAYIMAFLRQNGYLSQGFDFGDSEEDPLLLASRHRLDTYDIVGFSVFNESFKSAAVTAAWIKEKNPSTLIVIGGPQATAVHEHIARQYPVFDVIVRREGEETMLEIARRYQDRESLKSLAGATIPNRDGCPIVNPDRALLEDLDMLPFPEADFVSESGYPLQSYFDGQMGVLKPSITICSSRSCPYDCSFCGVLTIGRKYRARDPRQVVEEIRHFRQRDGIEYGHIYFSDANFFVSPKRALEIARSIHAYDSSITFSFGTRVNQLVRAEYVLPELKKLGLRYIEIGLESASPQVLKRLSKAVEPHVNVAAVRLLRRLKIDVSIDFIMLDPATTLEDVELNMNFLREEGFYDHAPHDHLYTALVLYEGTPIRKYYEDRLGIQFDPDTLPSPFTLFERPEVQRLSDELRSFRVDWQGQIDDALAVGEKALIATDITGHIADDFARMQLQLDCVALRHVPNLFLQRLLEDAKTGFRRLEREGRDALVDGIGHDLVSLDTVLHRVLNAAQAVGFAVSAPQRRTGRLLAEQEQAATA